MKRTMELWRHKEKFPPEISDYFYSMWDKCDLWSLALDRETLPISELEWHLDYPFWSTHRPGLIFNLMPRVVLANPQSNSRHWNRIVAADVSFPIHLGLFGGRLVILDGLHRLAKAVHDGATDLECKLVPKEHIRVAAQQRDGADTANYSGVRLGSTTRGKLPLWGNKFRS